MLSRMTKDPIEYVREVKDRNGDIAYLGEVGNRELYLVSNPDYAKHILETNASKYTRKHRSQLFLPLLGGKTLARKKDSRHRTRQLMQPNFDRKQVVRLIETMIDIIGKTLQNWQAVAQRGDIINIADEMFKLSMQSFAKTMFSINVTDMDAKKAGTALSVAFELMHNQQFSDVDLMNERYSEAFQSLRNLINEIIQKRYPHGKEIEDIFATFLSAPEPMSAEELYANVSAIIIAGSDPPSAVLSWCWHLLNQHPQVFEKLRQEVASLLEGRSPTTSDLGNLSYTRMILNETMRLYPPNWVIARTCATEDRIGDYHIPVDAEVFVCPYLIHRDRRYWECPEEFQPERFSDESPQKRHSHAFLPFGSGPHYCLGKEYAMVIMQLILTMVTQAYQLKPVSDIPVEPDPGLLLRLRHGLLVRLQPAA